LPREARGDQPGKVLPATLFSRRQVMRAKIVQKTGQISTKIVNPRVICSKWCKNHPQHAPFLHQQFETPPNNRKLAKTKATYL
jgi:hypothetical protein